jgi:hypothetical protein
LRRYGLLGFRAVNAKEIASRAPDRTDIYSKIEKFLKLPRGKLSPLAEHQRTEELKKNCPIRLRLCLRKCGSWSCGNVLAGGKRKYARFLKGSLLANWTACDAKAPRWDQESRQRRARKRTLAEIRRSTERSEIRRDAGHAPRISGHRSNQFRDGNRIKPPTRTGYIKKLEFVEKDSDGTLEEEPGLEGFLGNPSMEMPPSKKSSFSIFGQVQLPHCRKLGEANAVEKPNAAPL